MKQFTLLLVFLNLAGCTQKIKTPPLPEGTPIKMAYAQGFLLTNYPDYQLLEVTKAFPTSTDTLRYALIKIKTSDTVKARLAAQNIKTIQVPIASVVVTSTTHIPSLEMLEETHSLVGFPNLDYISSTLSRKRIANNHIRELGQNESINTEALLELAPDAIVSFGIEGENKSLEIARKAGIPIVYNGDWVEQNPLGKAEWIKFFGALYDKNQMADRLFSQIEKEYTAVQILAKSAPERPTVISGAMFKDVWYLPKGDSWPAQLIADAGGKYLWADTPGTGSLSLSLESVLEHGQSADLWIAPAQFKSYNEMRKASGAYAHFNAFKNKQIYTFAAKTGETGGFLYYELAPNRPDIVLKDMVHYLHPELLPNYEPFFFSALEE